MATTMKLISKQVLGSNSATVTFSSIPGTGYTDLLIVASIRSTRAAVSDALYILFNGNTTLGPGSNVTGRILAGNGSAATSTALTDNYLGGIGAASATSNTFSALEIYLPNYAGATNKSFSLTSAYENNATTAEITVGAHLWSSTAAVTSVGFDALFGDFVTGSSFFLYGISKA